MNVPIIDLKAQYAALEAEIDASLKRVCRSAAFALGPEVEQFERDWAAYCEAEHCIAVQSGTAALLLALRALDVGEGDEVITAATSFFATAEAIIYTGARPVFADVDRETACIDPARAEELITGRTRAIMPVHLFGHPADMDPLLELAEARGIAVIEDACQAHGALYKGRKLGALGQVGTYSFYPTKNLGAYGDAGAVVTNDAEIAECARMLRNHGQNARYHHARVGYNYRMSGFQGAVLNTKLPYLDGWNKRRRALAAHYSQALAAVGVTPAYEADWAFCVWHQYPIRTDRRDALQAYLAEAGVSTGIHYPIPIPDLEAMQNPAPRCAPADLPEAAAWAREELSLPMYAEMTDEQVEYVIETVKAFFSA